MLAGRIDLVRFLLQVLKDQLNHLRIFDAGNHVDVTAAVFADFDINIEDALETLLPSHGTMALCGALATPVGIEGFRFVGLLATLGRRHLNPMLAIGRKDAMEAREVNSRLGYQRGQLGHEV